MSSQVAGKAKIKTGAKVFCDFRLWLWPNMPHGKAEIIFDVTAYVHPLPGEKYRRLIAEGFGIKGAYGNGALAVEAQDLIWEAEG